MPNSQKRLRSFVIYFYHYTKMIIIEVEYVRTLST